MSTIAEAVQYYYPKKKNGELSLGEIREALIAEGKYPAEDIHTICKTISERELNAVETSKNKRLDFLHGIYFSIFMLLASIAIFMYAFNRYDQLRTAVNAGAEVDQFQQLLPVGFMILAAMFFVRHLLRLIKQLKR